MKFDEFPLKKAYNFPFCGVGNMVSKVVTSHKLEEAYEEGRP
jgi:hypothetical protein